MSGDLDDLTEGEDSSDIECEMCGEAPATAVVEAPISDEHRQRIEQTFQALHLPRVLVSDALMAVCAGCAEIVRAALVDALRVASRQPDRAPQAPEPPRSRTAH